MKQWDDLFSSSAAASESIYSLSTVDNPLLLTPGYNYLKSDYPKATIYPPSISPKKFTTLMDVSNVGLPVASCVLRKVMAFKSGKILIQWWLPNGGTNHAFRISTNYGVTWVNTVALPTVIDSSSINWFVSVSPDEETFFFTWYYNGNNTPHNAHFILKASNNFATYDAASHAAIAASFVSNIKSTTRAHVFSDDGQAIYIVNDNAIIKLTKDGSGVWNVVTLLEDEVMIGSSNSTYLTYVYNISIVNDIDPEHPDYGNIIIVGRNDAAVYDKDDNLISSTNFAQYQQDNFGTQNAAVSAEDSIIYQNKIYSRTAYSPDGGRTFQIVPGQGYPFLGADGKVWKFVPKTAYLTIVSYSTKGMYERGNIISNSANGGPASSASAHWVNKTLDNTPGLVWGGLTTNIGFLEPIVELEDQFYVPDIITDEKTKETTNPVTYARIL